MTAKTISVRLKEDESIAIRRYADFLGQPVSSLMKKTLLDQIEDYEDWCSADSRYEDWVNRGKPTISLDQFTEDFDL
ncbi:MAG: DUF6290 family protein [Candidatus Ancillula sp.]|jgi:hypothetical protein|nr:DUF6290 family protein [Candidatus Ancillula sp.]